MGASWTAFSIPHTTVADFEAGQTSHVQVIDLAGGALQLLPIGVTEPWQAAESLPAPRSQMATVARGNRLYVTGGIGADGINPTNTIYATSVVSSTENGAAIQLNPWQPLANAMPVALAGHIALLDSTETYLYILGGFTRQGPGLEFPSQDTIFRATMQPDGTISSWITETVRLPYPAHYAMGALYGQHLYFLGGQTVIGGSAQTHNEVHWADIDGAGHITAFQTAPALPKVLAHAMSVLYRHADGNATLFVMGGDDVSSGQGNASMFYADIQPDGSLSNWHTASLPLPESFLEAATVQVNAQILLAGGVGPTLTSGHRDEVISVALDPSAPDYLYREQAGDPVWRTTYPLPAPRYAHTGTWLADHIFVVGGANTHAFPQASVYSAPTRGLAAQYMPHGIYTGTMQLPENSYLQRFALETAITDTTAATITFAYQADSSQPWVDTDISSHPLVAAGQATNALTQTSRITYVVPIQTTGQVNYRLNFSTALSSTTPVLHGIELYYAPRDSNQVLFLPTVRAD
ncbi:MAG: hypothetical protein GXP41_07680 [Chloroflexi bacterium]|nr:hypothetical protein [Chloroflexota bacterium]